jgi:hypothetical protein
MPDTQGAVPLHKAARQAKADLEKAKAMRDQAEAPEPGQPVEEIQYPPGLPKSHYARHRQFLALQAQNRQREQMLGQRYGVGVSPDSVTRLRFQVLVDMIWPEGTPEGARARLEHDMRFQGLLAEQWAGLEQQAMQARLAAGAQLSEEEQKVLLKAQRQGAPGLFKG